jgi:hypothetical protein
MMRMTGIIAACALAWCASPAFAEARSQNGATACTSSGAVVSLPDLPEASGLAHGSSGLLWSHNDSGAPVIFAFDATGKPAGRLTIDGARVEDWEAIGSGPCPSGTCLYVGDIGDNSAKRRTITIYRVSEPAKPGGSVNAEALHASYPDGPHDAEALLVAPDGSLFIVTKGETGPITVYRFPNVLTNSPMRLERVGKTIAEKAGPAERVTDGAVSADGRLVVLRTRNSLAFYRGPEFLRGDFQLIARSNITALGEPQGEGVAFGAGDAVYVASEGGGKKAPGGLGVLSCRP